VAFVKVAWNSVTRALLDRERNALEHLASHADAMRIPDVLASGDQDGVAWLGLSPVAAFNRRRGDEATAFDVARTIELTAPAWTGDERTNPFLVRFQQDVAGAPRTSAAAAAYVEAVERGAGAPLLLAASHGDFVPWNLSTGRGLPAVWDWERYEEARPLGYDRFHYAFQCAIHRRGLDTGAAVAELRSRAAAILPEVAPHDAGWYADWYLLDLICRYERDGEAVALDSLLARVDAIATVLERTRRAP